jgi:hypothetical protein
VGCALDLVGFVFVVLLARLPSTRRRVISVVGAARESPSTTQPTHLPLRQLLRQQKDAHLSCLAFFALCEPNAAAGGPRARSSSGARRRPDECRPFFDERRSSLAVTQLNSTCARIHKSTMH